VSTTIGPFPHLGQRSIDLWSRNRLPDGLFSMLISKNTKN
jgi:hypothetical protein